MISKPVLFRVGKKIYCAECIVEMMEAIESLEPLRVPDDGFDKIPKCVRCKATLRMEDEDHGSDSPGGRDT